jgi:uncharacterized membrane protein
LKKIKFKRKERKYEMDKVLVVIFDNESKAYEGSKTLQDLQNEGSINLYAKAVIARDSNGMVTVKQQGDMGPVGTAVGLLTGSLIGLLGGPAGMIVGGAVGMYGGLIYDVAELGVGQDFLDEVGKSLLPGKTAVVAEVWEEWTQPVNTRMEALGGIVYRRTRGEALDEIIEKDIEATQADLAELEAEYERETGEVKAEVQARIDATKAQLQAKQEGIQARLEASQKETEAKIKSLQEQAAKARGERKAKLEKRTAELKAEQQHRNELLKQAAELIKEALAA